jgi:hypothetical protein
MPGIQASTSHVFKNHPSEQDIEHVTDQIENLGEHGWLPGQ